MSEFNVTQFADPTSLVVMTASGPMSGVDADKVDQTFFVGTNVRSNILVSIGYGNAAKLIPRSPRFACEEIAVFV